MRAESGKPRVFTSSLHPFNTEGELTIKPSHGKLVRSLVGPVGWDKVVKYLKGDFETELPERPSTHYLYSIYGDAKQEGALKNIKKSILDTLDWLNIEHTYFDEDFSADYLTAQKDVNSSYNTLVNLLNLPKSLYGQRDGVTSTADSVERNIRKLLMSTKGDSKMEINDVYHFRLLTQQLLSVVGLDLIKKQRRMRAKNELAKFVDWSENEVFGLPGQRLGDTENIDVFSLHKRNTGWNGKKDSRIGASFTKNEKGDKMQKHIEMTVRDCEFEGEKFKIFFDTRTKSDGMALIKAISKAIKRSGKKHNLIRDEIIILNDVIDIIGTKMVVVEGNKDRFVELYQKKLQEFYGADSIKDDSQTNIDEDGNQKTGTQSKRHTFTRKIIGNNIGTEIIIYSLQEYLNSEFDYGEYDKRTGIANGASHKIYELTRIAEVAKLLFPKEVYPNLNIDKYLRESIARAINQLKRKNSID